MNIKWPKKLSNEKVYGLTKTKPWSQIIRIQRFKTIVS